MSEIKVNVSDVLVDETVIVQYIPNFKNGITDKTSPLYGGLSNRSTIGICAPLLNGGVSKIFTREELDILSKELQEDLGPKSSFWKELRTDENGMRNGIFPIYIGKDGDMLNKKNAEDFIKIRVLEHANIVAKSPQEAKERQTEVRFLMLNKKDTHKEELETISFKRKANSLFGKIEDKHDVLVYVLRQFGRSVDSSQGIDFLQTEVYKLMEAQPKLFVDFTSDPLIGMKIKLEAYVQYGLVEVVKGMYYDSEGAKLSLDGKINDKQGAAEYLASGTGSEIKLVLDAKLEKLKK